MKSHLGTRDLFCWWHLILLRLKIYVYSIFHARLRWFLRWHLGKYLFSKLPEPLWFQRGLSLHNPIVKWQEHNADFRWFQHWRWFRFRNGGLSIINFLKYTYNKRNWRLLPSVNLIFQDNIMPFTKHTYYVLIIALLAHRFTMDWHLIRPFYCASVDTVLIRSLLQVPDA